MLYFIRRLLIEAFIGIAAVIVIVALLDVVGRYSDFIAVHFGWCVTVTFAAFWLGKMARNALKRRRASSV